MSVVVPLSTGASQSVRKKAEANPVLKRNLRCVTRVRGRDIWMYSITVTVAVELLCKRGVTASVQKNTEWD